MKIETSWTGLDGLMKSLAGVPEEASKGLARAIRAGTKKAKASVKEAAPRVTGKRVRPGIRHSFKGKGTATVGRVYLRGAAIPVATGTKPHEITAKKGKVLRLADGSFRRVVPHPGTAPNPFFTEGVEAAMPAIEAELDQVGSDIVKFMAK